MILPLLVLQFQATAPPAPVPLDVAAKPVHVWLGTPSPLARGSAVRVYVEVATNGNLVVLQRRTDGRIGVLFPTNPDRKSTRLNSSHSQISYAVFCLKKKKNGRQWTMRLSITSTCAHYVCCLKYTCLNH